MIIKALLPFYPLRLVILLNLLSFDVILLHHSCLYEIFSLLMICVILDSAITILVSGLPLKISFLLFKLLLALLAYIIFFVINTRHLKLVFPKLFFAFPLKFLIKFLLKLLSFSLKLLLQLHFDSLNLSIKILLNFSFALVKLVNQDLILEQPHLIVDIAGFF